MEVYELTHMFFRYDDELIYSPKILGFFYSYDNVKQAVQHYSVQPGFKENQNAFSTRLREVAGKVDKDTIFEAVVYLHSDDYEFEAEIELGLCGDEVSAHNKLDRYCKDNVALFSVPNLIVEKIVNRCILGHKEWVEGFSVSKQG